MDPIRRAAHTSVARGMGFTALAVFTMTIGLSFDPLLAARTGGVLSLITTVVLMLKARYAHRVDHRSTEAWLILEEDERPPADHAQRLTATALVEAYTLFARYSAGTAAGLFGLAVIVSMAA
jgi:hypothetical protein